MCITIQGWHSETGCCAGIKWQVLRQSTATLEIAVQLDRPSADDLKRPHRVYTWRGPLQKEEEEGNEELEALVEVSEDKRGFRSLVCTLSQALMCPLITCHLPSAWHSLECLTMLSVPTNTMIIREGWVINM